MSSISPGRHSPKRALHAKISAVMNWPLCRTNEPCNPMNWPTNIDWNLAQMYTMKSHHPVYYLTVFHSFYPCLFDYHTIFNVFSTINSDQTYVNAMRARHSCLFEMFVWLYQFRLTLFQIELTVCHLYFTCSGVVSFVFNTCDGLKIHLGIIVYYILFFRSSSVINILNIFFSFSK